MDVPESMLYGTTLVSQSFPVTVEASDHAARMFTPGALKSGCKLFRSLHQNPTWILKENKQGKSMNPVTLRMSRVIRFGPLDENETIYGANSSLTSMLLCRFATGLLQNHLVFIHGLNKNDIKLGKRYEVEIPC